MPSCRVSYFWRVFDLKSFSGQVWYTGTWVLVPGNLSICAIVPPDCETKPSIYFHKREMNIYCAITSSTFTIPGTVCTVEESKYI